MRIEFNKTVRNVEELKKFYGSPTFYNCYSICEEKTTEHYCDKLESRLIEAGNKLKRTDIGNMWISNPAGFSLNLQSEGLYEGKSIFVQEKRKIKKFFSKEIEIVESIEKKFRYAKIMGDINYQDIEGINPDPVLEILSKEGYSSKIITTPELIEEQLERLRTPIHIHHSDGGEVDGTFWHG